MKSSTVLVLFTSLKLWLLLLAATVSGFSLLSPTSAQCNKYSCYALFRNYYHYNQRGPGFVQPFQSLTATTDNEDDNGAVVSSSLMTNNQEKPQFSKKKQKIIITLWIHLMSGFVAYNYFRKKSSSTCWPSIMLRLPLKGWNLVHGLSAMVFAGSIVTTTVLEWNLFNNDSKKKKNDNDDDEASTSAATGGLVGKKVVKNLFQIETLLVLPALTGSMVSGVAQSFHSYQSLRHAPRHVKMSLHLLLTFGLWWGVTDRRTQGKVEEAADNNDYEASVWQLRRLSNIGSCLFLVALYCVMILKPGYNTG